MSVRVSPGRASPCRISGLLGPVAQGVAQPQRGADGTLRGDGQPGRPPDTAPGAEDRLAQDPLRRGRRHQPGRRPGGPAAALPACPQGDGQRPRRDGAPPDAGRELAAWSGPSGWTTVWCGREGDGSRGPLSVRGRCSRRGISSARTTPASAPRCTGDGCSAATRWSRSAWPCVTTTSCSGSTPCSSIARGSPAARTSSSCSPPWGITWGSPWPSTVPTRRPAGSRSWTSATPWPTSCTTRLAQTLASLRFQVRHARRRPVRDSAAAGCPQRPRSPAQRAGRGPHGAARDAGDLSRPLGPGGPGPGPRTA